MTENKVFERIVAVITAAAVTVCLVLILFSEKLTATDGKKGISMEYETELFDTSSPIKLDISIDSDKWQELLDNAIDEEYYMCSVSVNGTEFKGAAIRAKGNTSLSSIAKDPDSDRYSFKIEFDRYDSSSKCFGLDKLVLNSNYGDATSMKEAIVYDMYAYLDAVAPLYNYAEISINGEYLGVYLALEAIEESFLMRNFGTADTELYKPEGTEEGGKGGRNEGAFGDKNSGDIDKKPEMPEDSPSFGGSRPNENETPSDQKNPFEENGKMPLGGSGMFPPPSPDGQDSAPQIPNRSEDGFPTVPSQNDGNFPSMMPQGGKGGEGFAKDNGGADLNYTDDSEDSYSSIWDGEITDTGTKDHLKVIAALKNICEQTDTEKYADVDNILKYMAVHTFAVNLDSLSGNMAHNYYLYETNGKLGLIPWDYNLAWGGFSAGGGGASDTVNFPIDTPFSSGISLSDRAFFAAFLTNEEYLEKYHGYLRELCDGYVNGGAFTETYERIRSQTDELQKTDPTAFYSYDEYDSAAKMLCSVIRLRSESITGQLNGTVSSDTEAQKADSSALIDASDIDLTVMGRMSVGEKDRNEGYHAAKDSRGGNE